MQAKPKTRDHVVDSVHTCRAWIEVARSSDTVFRDYFSDIDAVGASYGLFVPSEQPIQTQFVVLKEGDYDGELYLIDSDCGVKKLLGGIYFLSEDKKYLFSVHNSDLPGLAVVNLPEGSITFEQKSISGISEFYQWYTDGKEYFFTDSTPFERGRDSKEDRGYVYKFDFVQRKLVKKKVRFSEFKNIRKVNYAFHPDLMKLGNCGSFPGK
jgi:hypothetical protein